MNPVKLPDGPAQAPVFPEDMNTIPGPYWIDMVQSLEVAVCEYLSADRLDDAKVMLGARNKVQAHLNSLSENCTCPVCTAKRENRPVTQDDIATAPATLAPVAPDGGRWN